jgi:uncharacterized protein YjbJ (UPF0337 family)
MDENRVEGGVREAAGRVRNAAGALAGDLRMQADGKAREIAGRVQGAYGDAVDGVRGQFDRNPVTVLLTLLGIGLLAGLLIPRRPY